MLQKQKTVGPKAKAKASERGGSKNVPTEPPLARGGSKNNPTEPPPAARGISKSSTRPIEPSPPGQVGKEKFGSNSSDNEPTSLGQRAAVRALSFICCSIEEIEEGIFKEVPPTPMSELPAWKFNPSFWRTILEKDPSEGFKLVQNRTLQFWVDVFNQWKEKGFPEHFNGAELMKLGQFFSNLNLARLVQLFDKEGYKRLQTEGTTEKTLKLVRVNVRELMMAGVILSKLISKRMKLRFTFGLVDTNDEHALDVEQFKDWIRAYICGLGAAFGVLQDARSMPCDRTLDKIADRLYLRISDIVGKKVREHCQRGSIHMRQQVLAQIKERQLLTQQDVEQNTPGSTPKGGTSPKHRQTLKFKKLEKWCLQRYGDPLALPYALALERFCRDREGHDVDEFNDSLQEWYLSHKSPVARPQDVSTVPLTCRMLTRAEVIQARDVFDYCSDKDSFDLKFKDLQQKKVPFKFWELIEPALRKAHAARSNGEKTEFLEFLRLVCPGAKAPHLRMFDEWCNQFDNLVEQRIISDHLHSVSDVFLENEKKEVLPADYLLSLEKEFNSFDREGRGYVTSEELAEAWSIDETSLREMFRNHHVAQDAYIDKHDYFRLTCPEMYRLPQMSGMSRDVLGKLVVDSTERIARNAAKMKELFAADNSLHSNRSELPSSLLPEVDDLTWTQWNDIFSQLDRNKDDVVDFKDLWASSLLSEELCNCLVTLLKDSPYSKAFSRASFLRALLEAHGSRRKLICSLPEARKDAG